METPMRLSNCQTLVLMLLMTILNPFNPLYASDHAVFLSRLSDAGQERSLRDAGPILLWASENWVLTSEPLSPHSEPVSEYQSDGYEKDLFIIHHPRLTSIPGMDLLRESYRMEENTWIGKLRESERDHLAMMGFELIRIPDEPHSRMERAQAYDEPQWVEPVQALVDQISPENAFQTIQVLASFETRFSNTQGAHDAADWIADEFRALGYGLWSQDHTASMAPNVIAEKTGVLIPDEIVIICGHYDSTSRMASLLAPGADDNASGVAGVLEVARVLSGAVCDRTIRFIAFSGEEQGLYGSQAYARYASTAGDRIIGVFNADMIGWASPYPEDLDCVVNAHSIDLGEYTNSCASLYVSSQVRMVVNGSLTYSDHSPFWQYGYPALLGIEDVPIEYPYYHTIEDTPDKIDTTLLGMTSRIMTATAASLAGVSGSAVFPDKLGVDLQMDDVNLAGGDWFRLGITYWNDDPVQWNLPVCIVLDAWGSYYFWPTWTPEIDSQTVAFDPVSIVRDLDILEFEWPYDVGMATGLHFWAGILSEDQTELVGEADLIEWGYY